MNKLFSFFILAALIGACTPKTTTVTTVQPDPNAFRKSAPMAGPAPTINIGDYQSYTMANGLKVILAEDHKIPAVSFNLTIDRDPIFEGDKAGYVSMMGDLMGSGTKTRSKADIDEMVDFIGADLYTRSSGIYANSLSKHTNTLLDLVSDILLNPSFPEEELEKNRKQTLSALAQEKDDPSSIASNVGQAINFGLDHPYGEMVTEKTVKNITRADCVNDYETYFKPNISYLVVTGDITMAELKPLTEKYFGSWKKGDAPKSTIPMVDSPTKSTVQFINKPGAVQSVISIAYPVDMKPGGPDAIKARIANALLGGFFGSRLNKNLREDKAYTYGARSRISSDRHIGTFKAGASVRNEVTDSAIVQFLYEMDRIVNEPVSADELQRVKAVLSGQFARSLEDKGTAARFALNTMKYNLPSDYYSTYLKKLNAVTVDDVMMMAKKYIRPEAANIIVVGNQDEVADKLKSVVAGGINYYDHRAKKIELPKKDVSGISADQVIDNYLKAIGGKEAIGKLQNVHFIIEAELMGQVMNIDVINTNSNQMKLTVSMGGQIAQQVVLNKDKGYQMGMGTPKMPMGEKEIAMFKEQAAIIKEAQLDKLGMTVDFKGLDMVDGTEAYKILLTNANGDKTTQYYDSQSGLKIREITTSEQGPQKITVVSTYADYRAVGGVKFPYKMTQSGMMPVPLESNAKSVKVNVDLPEGTFSVD